ncbi:hypothetical protein EVAR_14778_1 [Eumeta japonica]|uniref:Uncharacterized protein n=1 Tax=Eumeta variegata TaxID=151549 RepID=A0A4C1TWF2_EUMVA|nr:hypothetical protein EVAR_14778_1 [Eumeta japonica]
MCRFWSTSRERAARARRPQRPHSTHAIMSISCRQRSSCKTHQDSYHDSLNFVTVRRDSEEACELITEYLTRTDRLMHHQFFFSRLSQKPLPITTRKADYRLAYESPQNLALELSKSILYGTADSIDVSNLNLKSLNSHDDSKHYSEDSLWNGKPQQYFESMNFAERHDDTQKVYEDSLAT